MADNFGVRKTRTPERKTAQKLVVVEDKLLILSCNRVVSSFFLPKKNRFFNMVRPTDMRLRQ
jgi:hypothetical protein